MKNRASNRHLWLILSAVVVLMLAGVINVYCGQPGIREIIKGAQQPMEPSAADFPAALPDRVALVHVKHNGRSFYTETRKDKMNRFKCSQCHDNSTVTAENAAAIAHGDIVLDHGGAQKPLSCFTCHKDSPRDFFETEKGVTIDMDHVYELCGQCHFRQKSDWIGGAHGKRIGYWDGRRVVANCTSCHDPHSPLFKKRWPATYALPLE